MIAHQIRQNTIKAMKAGDKTSVSTLRFLQAEIKNVSIEKQTELSDEDILDIISRQVKRRRESIEQFAAGGRQDLVDKETAELEILSSYLPEQLTADELMAIVKEVLSETGATSQRDMGKVMGIVIGRTKGRADGKQVSSMVKECLKSK